MIVRTDEFMNCENEQDFKMKWINKNKGSEGDHFFCIETESTVLGFPDVLEITASKAGNTVLLYEFKFAKKGKIKFRPAQPAFYKKYKDLSTKVVAYNPTTCCVHIFYAEEILHPGNIYKINEKAEIDLTKAEHLWMKQLQVKL